ncbi:MAG: permease-like cell division protein FtsX [Fimbriimonadaceae bacterium]|nr:permease-like cell division protein FtsX [Fimbriimonadaceae bacterium]
MNRLQFLIGEAWASLTRHKGMTFATITTSAVALFLVGGLAYAYWRIDAYARSLPSRFEMRVFLRDGTTYDQVRETATAIRAIEGVDTVVHIPKDAAWQRFKRDLREAMPEDLGNPLPDAFKVILKDLEESRSVAASIKRLPAVAPNGVNYLSEEHELISHILRLLGWLGLGLFGTLVPTAGILIYIAIRLALHARRREIRIMSLVGATQSTILIPFLIEGTVQGAIGGALATPALYTVYRLFAATVEGLMATVDPSPFPLWPTLALLVVTGGAFGFVCSLVAARRPLREA